MLEKMTTVAERRANEAVKHQIERLAQTPTPLGVAIEAGDAGVTLVGKGLRRRMLADPSLRNFGR